VRGHVSARSRLTLLYALLFALGGAALVLITYLLVGQTLHAAPAPVIPREVQQALGRCLQAAQAGGAGVMRKCAAVYANGVQAGAAAQRATTLAHLLTYSLLSLAGATLLAAVVGWIVAGRILRPVHRLTAAARAASEQNLSQRIALQGPRDELRELADTFDSMLERLDRAFASQRQFIANASHELRTPLTLMRTAIDVVLAKPEPTREELMSMAAEVRQAVDHSERLIEVLLVLARNERARALTDPLDLAAVAEDALEGRVADGITTTTALGHAPVTGDRVLLERLVANLLDNAERYNVAGGTVEISTITRDATSVLRVVNTGAVVPADMVERLFLPFTRLDDRTRHDGFGLGLALVSSIAAVHGGAVQATAVPAGGLDVSVRLPRRDNAYATIIGMAVTAEDIEREKDRLPRGWGRFGKALEQLAGICEPDEALLSSCVTLNPQFRHTSASLGGALVEMTDSTNVVLAATSKRLILITTGMGGAPRKHYDPPWGGLQIAERKKNEFTLRTQAGEIRFRGAAKQQVPAFLDAVERKAS
jgi:signal transduction histidine kinase